MSIRQRNSLAVSFSSRYSIRAKRAFSLHAASCQRRRRAYIRSRTRRQEQLIRHLLKDFPDIKGLAEYESYEAAHTKRAASALISTALEMNWTAANQSEVYLKYIATRPRAERIGSHGLFGDEDNVDMEKAMAELEHYKGNVWAHIISLKREDATRLGYDSADAWRTSRKILRAYPEIIFYVQE